MKRWKTFLMSVVVCLVLAVAIIGCQITVDPLTGEKQYGIDPNIAAQIEKGVEQGGIILTALSAFWPALIPIITLVGGAYGTWHKIKPKLVKAQSEAELYYTLGDVTVEGIAEWRKLNPEAWAALQVQLEKIKDKLLSPDERKKIDNLIRGLCGKPPKE